MIGLYVDGCPCVIDGTQRIGIDYRAADLTDVESSREGLHIRLRLPATPENDHVLGNAADAESAERFNAEYHQARIVADGADIFEGTAYLEGVEIESGVVSYLLEIIGGASQWAKSAARGMFNEIGVEYEALLNMNEICDSWESDSPVKFLPVHRDQYGLQNGVTTLYAPERILTTDDYHPFISVAAMLRAIFEGAGYSVESRFFESEQFSSLYMSGAYPTTDVTSRIEQMDFRAGRVDSVTATANYAGRVYVTPLVAANSLGNIVDVVDEKVVDDAGNEVLTGFYSKGGCFAKDEYGVIGFTPTVAVKAGFEYSLKFACKYRIATRYALKSFDHIYFEKDIVIPFELTNRFVDHRDSARPNFEYRIVIFDYTDAYDYRLRCKADGKWFNLAEISSQTALVQTPAGVATITQVELMRAVRGTSQYEACTEDWALYGGFVAYEGTTEVEMTLRTPAIEITPTSPKYFDTIYFGGGESGWPLTLLPGTTLRPIFTSTIGYGSHLTFADVAQISVRQNRLLDAVRHLFNLRIYTDEREKRVYIEPFDDFVRKDEIYDWSDRVDLSQPILIEEQAGSVHERRTLCYNDEDGTVRRHNAESDELFGTWSFDVDSRAAIEGEEVLCNPLFTPTINESEVYANAESALVMQVCDRDDDDTNDNANFSPRIVRYLGMAPLAEGERWGYPYSDCDYPLAAFHFAGDDTRSGSTLCFEDRDGVTGLHSYYDRQFAEESRGRKVTLSLALSAEDFEHLFHFVEGTASIRSTFELNINGISGRYWLCGIEGYDPSKSSVRCSFAQIVSVYE